MDFDFKPAYKVAGHGGVAWRVTSYVTEAELISDYLEDEDGSMQLRRVGRSR